MPGSLRSRLRPFAACSLCVRRWAAIAVMVLGALSSRVRDGLAWCGIRWSFMDWLYRYRRSRHLAALAGGPLGCLYWSSLTVRYTLSLTYWALLLPLLRQLGVPVLEVIGLAGAYHYGDPNVFFVLALGRTALMLSCILPSLFFWLNRRYCSTSKLTRTFEHERKVTSRRCSWLPGHHLHRV